MIKLNEAQLDAVFSDADKIVCVAGAGSGKTAVLIERISRLIAGGVDPRSILCLTFTNAAAFEMNNRFKLKHPNSASPEFRTFHSFCYDILINNKAVRTLLGYTDIPSIADDATTKRILTHASKQVGVMLTKEKMSGTAEMTELEKYNYKLLKKSEERLMKKENVITYDTLIKRISHLFVTDNELILPYKEQFKYLMLDEFQDTDLEQWQFAQSFKAAKLFVVGDALQNLYSWRGTDSSIIKSLTVDPAWYTVKLEENYRSSKPICDYANKFTKTYARDEYRIELKSDRPGNLVSEHIGKWYRGRIPEEVLQSVLVEGAKVSGSSAILCRTNAEVTQVQEYLKSMKVEFDTNQKDTDAVHILKSAVDNEYMMDWLATFLVTDRYVEFIRRRAAIDNYDYESFLQDFGWVADIDSRAEKIFCVRRICNEERDKLSKMKDVLALLKIPIAHVNIARCQTNEELLQAISDAVEADYNNTSSLYVGTVHSVKGLEYDNVFVLGVDGPNFKLTSEDTNNIFYVAVTRARNNLHIYRLK